MSAKVFVDTNVLVYCRDASEPEKQAQTAAWMASLWEQKTGRLSFQVLQEYYVTVTAKLSPGLSRELARREVRMLLAWRPLAVDARLLEGAWLLQDRHKLSWVGRPHRGRGTERGMPVSLERRLPGGI